MNKPQKCHHAEYYPALKVNEAGAEGLQSQNFGWTKQKDHLSPGVQNQPGQHRETLSLQNIKN